MLNPEPSPRIITFMRYHLYMLVALSALLGCDRGAPPVSEGVKPAPQRVDPISKTLGNPDARRVEAPWTNMAATAGVSAVYQSGAKAERFTMAEVVGSGVGLFDYDGDGRHDLFFTGGGGFGPGDQIFSCPCQLYRNLGSWKFREVARDARAADVAYFSHGCTAADVDADGFVDVLVTGYGGLQLFHNQGDGTFRELSRAAGLTDSSWSISAGFGDLDGDGLVDLYVAHYVNWSFQNDPRCTSETPPARRDTCGPRNFDPLPDVLYLANGDGTFRDATAATGIRGDGKGLGVLLADLDHDGDLDLYVSNDTVDNFLYWNEGDGRLREAGLVCGVATDADGKSNGSMGIDVSDYNGDGLTDLWVTNFQEEMPALYKNQGSGVFLHASRASGVAGAVGAQFVGFGTAFADIDRDGDEDLLISNGHVIYYALSAPLRQVPLVLMHDDQRFTRAEFTPGHYLSTPHLGRGLAISDLDDDGRIDVVMTHDDEEPAAMLANRGDDRNHWLRVRLIGRTSNRDAIGARLVLQTERTRQLRHVKGGGSYLSQSDLRAFWGIAEGDAPGKLTVDWPSGRTSELPIESLDTTLTLIEP